MASEPVRGRAGKTQPRQQPRSPRVLAKEITSGGAQLPARGRGSAGLPGFSIGGLIQATPCSQCPCPPCSPRLHPFNLDRAHCRTESGRLRAHTIGGIYRIKSNEFWEMFLGAFKSSPHITEFNWAAADERVGGEPGEERGEGRAGHRAGGSRCSALSAGPEELCPGRERPRSSVPPRVTQPREPTCLGNAGRRLERSRRFIAGAL